MKRREGEMNKKREKKEKKEVRRNRLRSSLMKRKE